MNLLIESKDFDAVERAVSCAIVRISSDIRGILGRVHTDRISIESWEEMEKDITRIKTFRKLLDRIEAIREQERNLHAEAEKKEKE